MKPVIYEKHGGAEMKLKLAKWCSIIPLFVYAPLIAAARLYAAGHDSQRIQEELCYGISPFTRRHA